MRKLCNFGIPFLDDNLRAIMTGDLIVIGAMSGCVDAETEFFNGTCWKRMDDYVAGDKVLQYDIVTKKASLTEPLQYIHVPCDKFYHFKGMYCADMMLSPEHIVTYINCDGRYSEDTAENVAKRYMTNASGFHGRIQMSFDYSGPGVNLSDSELKIMLAVICDGSFPRDGNMCCVHVKKERKKQELRKILVESGISYSEYKRKYDGYSDFKFKAPRREKVFSSYWYGCSKHQLELICENVLKWDGSITNGRTRFTTTIKESADFVQFAFSACGYKAVILTADRRGRVRNIGGKDYITKHIEYNVSVTDRFAPSYGNKGCKDNLEVICGNFTKYCFAVPDDHLILRRNNKIFMTHNCGKTSLANRLAINSAEQGVSTVLFSLENAAGDWERQIVYGEFMKENNGCSYRDFLDMYSQHPELYSKYKESIRRIASLTGANDIPLFQLIESTSGVNSLQTLLDTVKFQIEIGRKLIIIDHIDHVSNEAAKDLQFIRTAMKELANLAFNKDVCIITFSQIRKDLPPKVMCPGMYDLKGGSPKTDVASVVITVARDPFFDRDDSYASLMAIRKDRYGKLAMGRLYWKNGLYLPNYTKITDFDANGYIVSGLTKDKLIAATKQ